MTGRSLWVFFRLLVLMSMLPVQSFAHPLGILEKLYLNHRLQIGITLKPYYSFVKNIVQDNADVIPVTGAEFDSHERYRPVVEDIERIKQIDILVINGIGHDQFVYDILNSARIGVNKLVVVHPNMTAVNNRNPHTFISIESSIRQIYNIANKLEKSDAKFGREYIKNARKYAARLRRIKAEFMARLGTGSSEGFRCATTHDGFGYLLQEFGLKTTLVMESKHGVPPTTDQLRTITARIKELGITSVFYQPNSRDGYAQSICRATGAACYAFSHLDKGEYAAEGFEKEMRINLEALTGALLAAQNR